MLRIRNTQHRNLTRRGNSNGNTFLPRCHIARTSCARAPAISQSRSFHQKPSTIDPGQISKILPLNNSKNRKTQFQTARSVGTSSTNLSLPSPSIKIGRGRRRMCSEGSQKKVDVIIVGGGHNGLISAAYLAKKGLSVTVLERREIVGGAAVTEEIFPGFKYSRGSYLAGLLRPHIIDDLDLMNLGVEFLSRDPSSFTPSKLNSPLQGKYLMLGDSMEKNLESIGQFSKKDVEMYPKYEQFLSDVREILNPLLDMPPPNPFSGSLKRRMKTMSMLNPIITTAYKQPNLLLPLYELFTGPATQLLNRYFESDILKATLATDAVIGNLASPSECGSAYVLLHHVMGQVAGKKGVWSYVRGGMGAISDAICKSATNHGVEIVTNAKVSKILCDTEGGTAKAVGVLMENGDVLRSRAVLSNANPYHTFVDLVGSANSPNESVLPPEFLHRIKHVDYSSGCMKINLAVDRLPNFECIPNDPSGLPGPQHFGTVHFENSIEEIEDSCREAKMGLPATRPVIEMTIPSALDKTLAPPGKHVVQIFVQGAPYDLRPPHNWDELRTSFSQRVYSIIDEFAPNFSSSILHEDILTPKDLETVFSLKGGNIHHGAIGIHQLAFCRYLPGWFDHRSPVKGLYICGAGSHPGGGVMGAPGHNCANVVMEDMAME